MIDNEKIVKEIITQKLGSSAKINDHITITNNDVFFIKHQDLEYVFKIYHDKNWPEDGKLLYINKLLDKQGIEYPKVLAYTRNHDKLKNGYLIEEKIQGENLLEKDFEIEHGKSIYKSLAQAIKPVHSITFPKYAYINNGCPEYDTLFDYIQETLENNIESINKSGKIYFDKDNITTKICEKFKNMQLQPVLCHGDLSTRNAIYNNGKIVLIDWDDAIALPWQTDIAYLTFDMKFLHNEKYEIFKQAFFESYNEDITEFNKFEEVYHIFIALDIFSYLIKRNKLNESHQIMLEYLNTLIEKL